MRFDDCTDHGDQLLSNDGPCQPCGLCGRMLYQEALANECPVPGCDNVIGMVLTRKWIGDAWVVDPADAAEVMPAAEAHQREAHSLADTSTEGGES